jgi:hypothetical protein
MLCQAKGFKVVCRALALAPLLLFSGFSTIAESVMLGWEPSPDPNAVGYNIYFGTTSHNYSTKTSVGNVTNTTLTGLVAGQTYFFAATTYDAANQESGFSNEASYAVPFSATNTPPTLNVINNVVINQNAAAQTVAISGISSGSANENQTLTVTAASDNTSLIPNPGVIYTSPNATGSLTFTPVSNAYGSANITVTVKDSGASNNIVTRSFKVTVNPVNQTPTLNAINNLTVNQNAAAQSVTLTGISSGSANENQTLTVTAASDNTSLIPNPGVIYSSPNTTGSLTFTPVSNAYGSANITVTVKDSGASNNIATRSFKVTVNPVNQTPTLNAINNLTLNQNAAAQSVALTGISSGSANENQTLTVTATSDNTSLIPNPGVIYSSPNTTGSLTFTPVSNAYGSANITVTLKDSGASNNIVTRSFKVTVNSVNQPPTLNAINNLTVNQNAAAQSVALSGISSGSANESQTLTVTAASSNPSLIPNPSITYTSPNTTGSLVFKPVAGATGEVNLTVTVKDGGTSNNIITRSFTVTVNPVNQPPTLDPIGNVTLHSAVESQADSPPTLDPIGDRLILPNSSYQSINLTGISSGTVGTDAALTINAVSSFGILIPNPTVTYSSPNSTATLTFKPTAGWAGTTAITVIVRDSNNPARTTSQTFLVTVWGTPTVPSGIPVITKLTTSSSAIAGDNLKFSVAANGSSLKYQWKFNGSNLPSETNAVLSLNAVSPSEAGNYSVVVFNGVGAVNSATTTLEVTPQTNISTGNAVQNPTPLTVYLTGISSGTSTENQTLTVTAVSSNPGLVPNPTVNYTSPNSTGSLTLIPVGNTTGSAVISVSVNDGGASNSVCTRSFTVTVTSEATSLPNQQPTLNAISNLTINANASSQTVALSGITSGSANESQALSVSATSSNPSLIPNPTVAYTSPNSTGSLTFTPTSNASGSATISVSVNDGSASNNIITRTFTITVNPVAGNPGNQQPTLNPISNLTLSANAGVQSVALSGITSGSAGENQTLAVSAVSSNPSLIPNPAITYTSANSTGTLLFAPANNATGSATIVVTVNDGAVSNNLISRTFTVTVNPTVTDGTTNNPPTLNSIKDRAVLGGFYFQTVNLSGISTGDPDQNQNLKIKAYSSNRGVVSTPSVSYKSPSSKGSISFIAMPNSVGKSAITISVTDDGQPSRIVTQTFIINVLGFGFAQSGAPSITSLETTNMANLGQDLAFSVTAKGSGTLSYQWQFNGGDLTSETNSILDLKNVTPEQSGDYSVIVFNSRGAIRSATTHLSVSDTRMRPNLITMASNPLPPQMMTLTPAGFNNGAFSFYVSGASNQECVIQSSSNLVDWVSVGTNVTPFLFTDPSAGQKNMQFYRTLER